MEWGLKMTEVKNNMDLEIKKNSFYKGIKTKCMVLAIYGACGRILYPLSGLSNYMQYSVFIT